MITCLQLKNIKAWRDSGSVRLAPVTMLLGTNASGKSTLLQCLLLLKQTITSPDRTIHLNLGGDEASDFFNFGTFEKVLTHGSPAPREFGIAFDFVRPQGERIVQGRFSCSYGQVASGGVVVRTLELSCDGRRFRAVRRDRGAYAVWVDDETQPRGQGRHLAPERSIAFSAQAIALLGPDGAQLQDLSLAIRRELEGMVYLGSSRCKLARDYVWNKTLPGEIGGDGHRVMDALLASSLLKGRDQGQLLAHVSHWLKKMGLVDRIEVRQVGRSRRYEIVIVKDGVEANLHDAGFGVSQVLPVVTVAYFVPPGSTVLLEEPEIHLHPLAQSVLAEMLAEVSQQRQVQFLVETHSEHVFRRMQTLIAREQTTTDLCQMLFVERQGAAATLVHLEVDAWGIVRNWPTQFFGDAVGEAREQAKARALRLRSMARD